MSHGSISALSLCAWADSSKKVSFSFITRLQPLLAASAMNAPALRSALARYACTNASRPESAFTLTPLTPPSPFWMIPAHRVIDA